MNALETMVNFCRENSKQISLWIDIEPAAAELTRLQRVEQEAKVLVNWIDDNKSTLEGEFDVDILLSDIRAALGEQK